MKERHDLEHPQPQHTQSLRRSGYFRQPFRPTLVGGSRSARNFGGGARTARRVRDELMKTDAACAAEILFQLARALADRQYL
jgi:hypothetical protein